MANVPPPIVTTAVAISAHPTQLSATQVLCKWVALEADAANVDTVYHGDSSVTTALGSAIAPGGSMGEPQYQQQESAVYCYDLSAIYIDGTIGDTVRIRYQRR